MNLRVLLPLMKHARDGYLRAAHAVNQRERSMSDWEFTRTGNPAAFAEKRILCEPLGGVDEPHLHRISGKR
jgi:hypothetical protein